MQKCITMLSLAVLQSVIDENNATQVKSNTIERDAEIQRPSRFVTVITGVRRCGKSFLLRQSMLSVKRKIFLNFEDIRLDGFVFSDFNKVEKIALDEGIKYLVFEEIQSIEGWEKYVRSAHDKGFHIYITGSNASMLSRELGTRLTGRHIQKELFPFNYSEFLSLRKKKGSPSTLREYLFNGGFPEYLLEANSEFLRTLLRDIVVRDTAVRRGIRNEHILLQLALYLMSNVGKEISYNNLSNTLEIKSVRTTIDYCNYLNESYLFDFVPLFSFSARKQMANPKKAYSVDTGMARASSLSFSEDSGRMLENAVYIKLRRSGNNIFYFRDSRSECDFIVKENERVVAAIQVCSELNDDNLKREITGLKTAMEITKAKKGYIVSFDQEDEFDGIRVIPAWKWLQTKMEI